MPPLPKDGGHDPSSGAWWWNQCIRVTRCRKLRRWNRICRRSRCPVETKVWKFVDGVKQAALTIVSTSHSPAKGDKPDTLRKFILRCEREKSSFIKYLHRAFGICTERASQKKSALTVQSRNTHSTYAMTPTDHISVANVIASKFTTSGATNSGVPNRTCSFVDGSYSRASPKSMILIRFPLSVRHKMFSGCSGIKAGVKKNLEFAVCDSRTCHNFDPGKPQGNVIVNKVGSCECKLGFWNNETGTLTINLGNSAGHKFSQKIVQGVFECNANFAEALQASSDVFVYETPLCYRWLMKGFSPLIPHNITSF